jgi:tetratricopeptide (TPR) repeat protein
MRALLLPLLAAALLAPGCGDDPPPGPPPSPAPAPAPAPSPVSPARKPVDPQDQAYEFQIARARDLANRAGPARDLDIGKEAFDAFRAASRIRPKDPLPLAEAGLLALDLGDGAHAARMLAALQEAAPESGPFHFLRGSLLEVRSEFQDALAEFQAAAERAYRAKDAKDHVFRCTVGYGLQLADAARYDDAVKALAAAVEMKPDDPLVCIAYYNMGVAFRRLESTDRAGEVLRRCMEKFPSYAPAYGELGDLLAETDRFEEAMDVLRRSVKADRNYPRGWLLMANVLTMQGKYGEAGECFAEYDRQFPASADSEFFRGEHLRKKGEPKAAIESFGRVLALDPGRIRAFYFLALCHRDLGEEAKSTEYMDRWKKASEDLRKRAEEHLRQAEERVGPAKGAPKPGDKQPPGGGKDRDAGEGPKSGDGG